MRSRLALTATTSLLATVSFGLVGAPVAHASDHSTFTVTTSIDDYDIPAGGRVTMSHTCPVGQTPISAGVNTEGTVNPQQGPIYRDQDYVNFGDDANVEETLHNFKAVDLQATLSTRCADSSWFHATTRVVGTFQQDPSTKRAGGYVACPSGSLALSARIDWNNTKDQQSIDYSGPTADLKGWFAAGYNAGLDNYMFIDLQCVAASDFPGAFLVQDSWKNTETDPKKYVEHDLDAYCPFGMTVLNGGTYLQGTDGNIDFTEDLGNSFASYPSDTYWNSAAELKPGVTMNVITWCIPNVAPKISIVSSPPTYTATASATVAFTASDPAQAGGYALSYLCSLDNAAATPCTSPWTGTVPEGSHYLSVWVTTSDGRRTAAFTPSWVFDDTPPTSTMVAPTAPFSLSSPVAVAWRGADGLGSGVSSFYVRSRQATDTGSFGAFHHPAAWQNTSMTSGTSALSAGSTACFSSEALDRAANLSVYSAQACTAMPVDDASLTAGKAWQRVKSSEDWKGTSTSTTAKNATLSLAGVHLDRVGVVADTCPTCGRVSILVGRTKIGTLDLHSDVTRHKVILALPKFAAATGKVRVKVLSTGKTVTIDGLATSLR